MMMMTYSVSVPASVAYAPVVKPTVAHRYEGDTYNTATSNAWSSYTHAPSYSHAETTYAPSYTDASLYYTDRSRTNVYQDNSYTNASQHYTDASQQQLIQYFIQNNYMPTHVHHQPKKETNHMQLVYFLIMMALMQRGVDRNTAHAQATATAIASCECPSARPEHPHRKHPAPHLPTTAVGSMYGDPYVSIGVMSRDPRDGFSSTPVGRTVLLKDVSDRLGVVGNFVESKDTHGDTISYMNRLTIDNDGASLIYDANGNLGNGSIRLVDAHGNQKTVDGTRRFKFGDGEAWLENGTSQGASMGADGTARRTLKVKTAKGNIVNVDLTRGPLGGKTVSLLNADFQATRNQKDMAGLVGDFFQAGFVGAASPQALAEMNRTIRKESTYNTTVNRLGVLDKDDFKGLLPASVRRS